MHFKVIEKMELSFPRAFTPVEFLFPDIKMSSQAYLRAREYIDETVRQKGVVESYMYGFRRIDDPEHVVRELYFPHQRSSKWGVEVDTRLLSTVFREFREKGFMPNSWIHHHCYGPLQPSGPAVPPVNDWDGSKRLLDVIGLDNYKQFDRIEEASLEQALTPVDGSGTLRLSTGGQRGLQIVLRAKESKAPDLPQLLASLSYLGISIPTFYSYVYCIIMNPSIPNPNALNRTKLRLDGLIEEVVVSIEAEILRDPEVRRRNLYQSDIFRDPYAGVFWRKWTTYGASDDYVKEKQVRLSIVNVDGDIPCDLETIRREVKERVQKSKVRNTAWFLGLPSLGKDKDQEEE